MDFFQMKMEIKAWPVAVTLLVFFSINAEAHKHNTAYVADGRTFSDIPPHVVPLDHARYKRETPAPPPPAPAAPSSPTAPAPPPAPTNATAPEPAASNVTDDSNRTTMVTNTTTMATAVVTQVPPILGANGTGIKWSNMTENEPKVSDPIHPTADDNSTDADTFETPEKIQAEHHLANLTYDNHDFYYSSFIGNVSYFNEYWANITKNQANVHTMLSNSHRRATTIQLSFMFPFYGNWIRNITVATGGFIYSGEHTHAWLAATQYIAPLMANFDTSINNNSYVKLSDDGEKFTAFWENVSLREEPDKQFTFAVTLEKNGDIVFAYKQIPMDVQTINDSSHPVKIGISDAYLNDRVIFYVRRKTIYEYHRVSFKNHNITNSTIIRLTALPTCLQYDSCDSCLNHNTTFSCSWCENIKKCSSGKDRNKQDWYLRNCDKSQVSEVSKCPAALPKTGTQQDGSTAYVTDKEGDSRHEAVVNTLNTTTEDSNTRPQPENSAFQSPMEPQPHAAAGIGGVVAALLAVTLVCGAAAWALYAFKNPHTRSGQILIKYRPSQWSWRRGEARYTAATIHM